MPSRRQRARLIPIRAPFIDGPIVDEWETSPPPIHPFDRLHGTDTGGLIPRAGILTGHPSDAYLTAYYATAPSILTALLHRWLLTGPPVSIEHYTFLDVGAGKGRVLLAASEHPFRAAVGIELNPALAAIARENLMHFARSAAAQPLAPVTLLEGDALAVPLPVGPLLVFLFHPFEAPLLRRFLARLAAHPAPVDILYVNAEHAAVLDRHPAFSQRFFGAVPMSAEDHLADLAEIASQKEYGSTGDEICAIYRRVQPASNPLPSSAHPTGNPHPAS